MLSYTPETINEVDRQCQPWPVHYIVSAPSGFRIYPTADADGAVIAWNISGSIDREPMTIWLPAAHRARAELPGPGCPRRVYHR